MKTNIPVSRFLMMLLLTGSMSVAQVPERPVRQELPPGSVVNPTMTLEQAQAIMETNRLRLQQQVNPAANTLPPTALGNPAQPGAVYGRVEPVRQEPPVQRINLDFTGGTPKQLVSAIEKATGEPLNVIIHEQDREVMLPAVKMRQVTVEELFTAMEQGSRRKEAYVTGTYFGGVGQASQAQYTVGESSFGFYKTGAIWVFKKVSPVRPPAISTDVPVVTRFYQLQPYLEGHSVEDITTAIHTAWKMMADANKSGLAELKFHKETGLLIAVGDSAKVQMIDDVLNALRMDPTTGLPVKPAPKTNVPPRTKPE